MVDVSPEVYKLVRLVDNLARCALPTCTTRSYKVFQCYEERIAFDKKI